MSNFAPGTSAKDIMHAVETVGAAVSCIVLTETPSVIAEVVFARKEAADKCIATFNRQWADGECAGGVRGARAAG